MVEVTDEEIAAARERGRIADLMEPRAKAARYDRKSGRIAIDLANGSTFMFPAHLAQGLVDANENDLAQITIKGDGFALHWETLDVGFTVPGLMSGIFGTRKYMAQLAGRATSASKAAAARENGKKGGRPRKTAAATAKPAPTKTSQRG
jgi:hypothetical protein